jgi:long-chain acyl-CoA synthetase
VAGFSRIDEQLRSAFWRRSYPAGVREEVDAPDVMYHELAMSSLRSRGGAPCCFFAGSVVRCSEVLDYSLRFASFLRSRGVREGSRVGLVLPNSPQFIVAYLGILMAGGTVVPMNPLYKSSELRYIVTKSGTVGVVCLDLFYGEVSEAVKDTSVGFVAVSNIADLLPAAKRVLGRLLKKVPSAPVKAGGKVYLFRDALRHRPLSEGEVFRGKPAESWAAICFTSGTTGLPKGAVLTHRNLVANIHQSYEVAKTMLSGEERVLAVLPFFHIYGQTAIMGMSLAFGFSMVVLPRPDLGEILRAIEKYGVTIVFGVPALYNAMVTSPNFRREVFSSVKLCVSGADKLHPEIARRFEDATGLKIVEGYGLTETSPVTHLNPPASPRIGSIGLPLPSTYAWIFKLDSDEPLQVGEVGELAVSGPQVMWGYLDDPESNRQVFFEMFGRTWLRTGDIARMDEEGFFYILERRKDLIKYKGWSIYPAEIENIVLRHEAVKAAAVVGVPDIEVGERVVLFVAPKAEYKGRISEEEVLEWCRANVPVFAVPSAVFIKDELPVSMTGKVLRRILREEAIALLKK